MTLGWTVSTRLTRCVDGLCLCVCARLCVLNSTRWWTFASLFMTGVQKLVTLFKQVNIPLCVRCSNRVVFNIGLTDEAIDELE